MTAEEQAALAEDVDLEVETRRRVLLMHRMLDRADHYALLGVTRADDRKRIKRAYFELAAAVHPDKYFRKNLGSYKQRMEVLFGRLTLAHDVLTHKDRRAEYDAYLDEQRRSRGIEQLLADALAEIRQAQEDVVRQVEAEEPQPATLSPPPAERPSTPPLTTTARRDALARKLLAGRSSHPGPLPPAGAVSATTAAMDALRRRYEDRMTHVKAAQAQKYVDIGEAAIAANDPVAAAKAFRVAQSLRPNDPGLAEMAASAQARADAILLETYTRQALYEEKRAQWVAASRSWSRVCRLRPNDAEAHARAARAYLKADTDLHEGSRLADRACTLDPSNPGYRVSLAKIYLLAGLTANARRELETARQLAPHDGTIDAMLKRIGKPA